MEINAKIEIRRREIMDREDRKVELGKAVKAIIKILVEKGCNQKEANDVLFATQMHLREVINHQKVEDTSNRINSNFINCSF